MMQYLRELLVDSSWPKAMVDEPRIRRRIMILNPVTTRIYGVVWTILLFPMWLVVLVDWIIGRLASLILRRNVRSNMRPPPPEKSDIIYRVWLKGHKASLCATGRVRLLGHSS